MLTVDANGNISLTRGDTGIFEISVTNPEGEPYISQEGDSMRFAMAKKYGDGNVLINKQIPIDTKVLQLDPEDTSDLPFSKYVYDIEYTDSEGHVSTIISGAFEITKEVC